MTDLPPDTFSRGSRAVVVDDGVTLQLHAFDRADGPPTIVVLTPLMAQELARDLLAAALRHLRAGASPMAPMGAPQGREPA